MARDGTRAGRAHARGLSSTRSQTAARWRSCCRNCAGRASDRDALRAAADLTDDGTCALRHWCWQRTLRRSNRCASDCARRPAISELALLCARLRQRLAAAASTLDAADLLDLLEEADALRRPERFERLLLSAAARQAAAAPTATADDPSIACGQRSRPQPPSRSTAEQHARAGRARDCGRAARGAHRAAG